jgi:hypothetical protein
MWRHFGGAKDMFLEKCMFSKKKKRTLVGFEV